MVDFPWPTVSHNQMVNPALRWTVMGQVHIDDENPKGWIPMGYGITDDYRWKTMFSSCFFRGKYLPSIAQQVFPMRHRSLVIASSSTTHLTIDSMGRLRCGAVF